MSKDRFKILMDEQQHPEEAEAGQETAKKKDDVTGSSIPVPFIDHVRFIEAMIERVQSLAAFLSRTGLTISTDANSHSRREIRESINLIEKYLTDEVTDAIKERDKNFALAEVMRNKETLLSAYADTETDDEDKERLN